MEEIYSDATKITPKPFFVSALILESAAVIILVATLLIFRFFSPEFFKDLKGFYIENVCYNAVEEGKNTDEF